MCKITRIQSCQRESNYWTTSLVEYRTTGACSAKSESSLQMAASQTSTHARYRTSSGSASPILRRRACGHARLSRNRRRYGNLRNQCLNFSRSRSSLSISDDKTVYLVHECLDPRHRLWCVPIRTSNPGNVHRWRIGGRGGFGPSPRCITQLVQGMDP